MLFYVINMSLLVELSSAPFLNLCTVPCWAWYISKIFMNHESLDDIFVNYDRWKSELVN